MVTIYIYRPHTETDQTVVTTAFMNARMIAFMNARMTAFMNARMSAFMNAGMTAFVIINHW